MPSGKGPGFQKKKLQHEWIESQMPAYIKKIAHGKPTIPGQPLPKDDDDLRAWVLLRCGEFEKEFQDELNIEINALAEPERPAALKRIRAQFEAKFRNKKSAMKALWQKKEVERLSGTTVPPLTSNPSFILLDDIAPTARTLFEQDSKDLINNEVKAMRAKDGVDYKKHAAMYQSEVKRRWDNLPALEKQAWEDKAAVVTISDNIYRNQSVFVEELTNILCGLIGAGHHQIGNAAIQLLYGFRDQNETLRTGSIAVRANTEDLPFDESDAKYNERTMVPWQRYCQIYIKNNRESTVANDKLECDDQGQPLFPSINENDLTVQEVRQVLGDYIQAQWNHTNSAETIPWVTLADHVALDICDQLSMLGNPKDMSNSSVFNAVAFIKTHQRANGAFNLFHYQFSEDSTQLLATAQPMLSSPISSISDVPEHVAPPSTAPTTHPMSSTASSKTPDVPKHAASPSTAPTALLMSSTTISNAPNVPARVASPAAPQLGESAPPTTTVVLVAVSEALREPPAPDDVETMDAPTATSATCDALPHPTKPGLTAIAPSAQTLLVIGNPLKSKKRPSAGKTSAAPTTKRRKIDQATVSAPRRSGCVKAVPTGSNTDDADDARALQPTTKGKVTRKKKAEPSGSNTDDADDSSALQATTQGKAPRKNHKHWTWEVYPA